jgi:hypothetical protein
VPESDVQVDVHLPILIKAGKERVRTLLKSNWHLVLSVGMLMFECVFFLSQTNFGQKSIKAHL